MTWFYKFQSTLPCGSDGFVRKRLPEIRISIHAPLRERQKISAKIFTAQQFQSTLPCGSDDNTLAYTNVQRKFQSTLPCGSDLSRHSRPAPTKDFNPRSLVGATCFRNLICSYTFYFNPRSLAGATIECYDEDGDISISIHAPLRERLKSTLSLTVFRFISIHAPLRERPNGCITMDIGSAFQSTLPCGSD
mgnify:FL=1